MTEKPGILSRITAAQEQKYKPKCGVGQTIEKLSKEDQAELLEALADPKFFGSVIADVLGVSEHSLRRHRRKKCLCNKKVDA